MVKTSQGNLGARNNLSYEKFDQPNDLSVTDYTGNRVDNIILPKHYPMSILRKKNSQEDNISVEEELLDEI